MVKIHQHAQFQAIPSICSPGNARKPENLTRFTNSKCHQKKENQQTLTIVSSVLKVAEIHQHAKFQAIPSNRSPANARQPLRTDGRTCRKTVTVGRMDQRSHEQVELEIVDQWSTRIPPPHRRGWHCSKSQGRKRHSWQSLRFCLQPQRTCTWNLKLKFQSKLELRCRNHAIQKPRNLIWPPGSHLENEVTENQ